MKRILFIIPSLTQTNGISAFIKNYIEWMDCTDMHIEILCSDKRPSKDYLDFYKARDIKVTFMPQYKEKGLMTYIRGIAEYFKVQPRFDLIYSNVSYQSFIYFFFAILNGSRNFAIHSHATEASESKVKKAVGGLFQFANNRIARHKVACSNMAGKAMFKNEKFVVVHNAVDYSKYSYNEACRKQIREKLGVNEDTRLIGFVGRYMKQKNIYFFIELAKALNAEEKILMIGSGDLQEEFIRKTKEEGVYDSFIFISECNNVYEYYSAMDVFALPSLYEGLPVTAVEAQANGLPCLLSDRITEETKISDNTFFYGIDNAAVWVNAVRNTGRNEKYSISDDYDIKSQAEKFKQLLMGFCKE